MQAKLWRCPREFLPAGGQEEDGAGEGGGAAGEGHGPQPGDCNHHGTGTATPGRLNSRRTLRRKDHNLYLLVQGALAGSAVLGLGALAYYGAGMSGEMGAVDK